MTRTRLTTAAAVALVLLTTAGCGDDPVVEADPPAPVTTTMAKMSAAEACKKASLLVGDATTNVIAKLVEKPDASTINVIELRQIIMEMKGLVPQMPEETLAEDLEDLIEPLEQIDEVIRTNENQEIDTGVYPSRGPGLIISCGRYTT